jgi:hypothetical protein
MPCPYEETRTHLALLTSLRKGGQRAQSRSLTPPKPRGLGMTPTLEGINWGFQMSELKLRPPRTIY